ncbi:MAG: CoA-binding protein [Chloroflexi bacterium]|nr:CoA-binding protein [Chloroflexota bacterium]
MRTIEQILRESKIIAIVGLSPRPWRDSYQVGAYLKEHGYRVIPVNPAVAEVLGERCYPDLRSIPVQVDVVDIFRRAEEVPAIVEQAADTGATVVWMQLGIVSQEAADEARGRGMDVVMDRCIKTEHQALVSGESK